MVYAENIAPGRRKDAWPFRYAIRRTGKKSVNISHTDQRFVQLFDIAAVQFDRYLIAGK